MSPIGGKATTRTYAAANVILDSSHGDFDAIADRSAQTILTAWPAAAERDSIRVSVVYGFDIGIASSWRSQNFSFTPSEWKQRIDARANRPSPQ